MVRWIAPYVRWQSLRGSSELLGVYQMLIPGAGLFCFHQVRFSKRLNISLKSGLVSMSIPDHQVIQDHFERRVENGQVRRLFIKWSSRIYRFGAPACCHISGFGILDFAGAWSAANPALYRRQDNANRRAFASDSGLRLGELTPRRAF